MIGLGPNKVMSVPDAVGIALEKYSQDKQGVQTDLLAIGTTGEMAIPSGVEASPALATGQGGEQIVLGGMQHTLTGACPDCGSQLEYAEGCAKCHVCGFSECG